MKETDTPSTDRYLMESPAEVARLEAKTDPAETLRQLELVGVEAGMRVIDAGAGSGAVARTIARKVGPDGDVVAFDGSEGRLRTGRLLRERAGELQGMRFVAGDLLAPPFAEGSFDLVWSRFVFEYLEAPDRVLEALARLVRPGGKVVVGDLDGNALFHDPMPAELARDLARLQESLEGRFDPFAGRKLYHRFRRCGLGKIQVHAFPYHLYAGPAPEDALRNWTVKFETLATAGAAALGGVAAYDSFRRRFLDLLRDPDSLTYSVQFLVEGVRPTAREADRGP